MNKIIITGHPASGLGDVESLLLRCGMRPALPSRREGLKPKEIHDTLRKAHRIPDVHTITDERGLRHEAISPVWHGMAMDLLLANIGQEPWGWADPNTLLFLDYWRTLDLDSVFLLVYDDPASALRKDFSEDSAADDEDSIQKRLDNWSACNSAILRFYFQNVDRCVLIHSRELRDDSRCCLEEIQIRLSAPLDMEINDEAAPPVNTESLMLDAELVTTAADIGLTASMLSADSPTALFLIESQLERRPQYRALYDELQAAANLPSEYQEPARDYGNEAWVAWHQEQRALFHTIKWFGTHWRESESNLDRLRRDHQLTSLQHAQACEETEQILLENRSLRIELEAFKQTHHNPEPTPEPIGAAERVKQQLSYRLGSLLVSDSKSPIGFVCLPLSLVLESLRYRREKHKNSNRSLPPLHEYADADEGNKVKKQLSYRLGNTLVRRSKSPLGWIILPFALIRQHQAYHRSRSHDA